LYHWRSICSNSLLNKTTCIVALNKTDLLESKLNSGIYFGQYVEQFGHRPNDVHNVCEFYKQAFIETHRKYSPPGRECHVIITCALDVKTMARNLQNVKAVIGVNPPSATK